MCGWHGWLVFWGADVLAVRQWVGWAFLMKHAAIRVRAIDSANIQSGVSELYWVVLYL